MQILAAEEVHDPSRPWVEAPVSSPGPLQLTVMGMHLVEVISTRLGHQPLQYHPHLGLGK
jgi:hypothetical protein